MSIGINAIISLALLVALVCFFYGPWQATCTDYARQLLFERRDKLFDLAANGKLDFNSENYKEIRLALEGFIRFAHELNLMRLLCFRFFRFFAAKKDGNKKTLQMYIDEIADGKTRETVSGLVGEATLIMVVMMTFKSIVLLPAALLLIIIRLCGYTIPQMVRKSRLFISLMDTIEADARNAKAA